MKNISERDTSERLTDSFWFIVTSSTLVLKCGIHGGSTIGKPDSPIVGDGKTKSMLGGGIWQQAS